MDRPGKLVAFGTTAWLAAALVVGFLGLLANAKPPAPQILIAVLTVGLLILVSTVPHLKQWAATVPVRLLVVIHLTRFVGIYFLILAARGELARSFAISAGWGDIAVAVTALVLLFVVRPDTGKGRKLYLAWNVLGMVDILLVVANAARTGFADPASMKAMLHLPLSLLPTFLVPIIIVSHVILFRRLK